MVAAEQRNSRARSTVLRATLAVAGWLAIAAATLTPTSGDASAPAFGCIICGPDGGIDAIANVLLFAPLGAGLAIWGLRGRTALAAVALTTLAVEVLQLRLVAGRDTSLGDLVWNAVGGALAFGAVRHWRRLTRPTPRLATALTAGWATLWTVGTVATAWSLAPALAPTGWVSHVGAPVTATGRVPRLAGAALDEIPLATAMLRDRSALMRHRLLQGGTLTATGVVPATGAEVNVIVVDDAATRQIMAALLRTGAGLTYYQRTRAAILRLRSPSVTLAGAFAGGAHPIAMRGARRGSALVVEAGVPGGAPERATARMTPNWGWSLLLRPGLVTPVRAGWFSALWVAVLVAPVGYWAARGWAGGAGARAVGAASVAAPGIAFLTLPSLFETAAVPSGEWAAWLAGVVAGALLAARSRSRARPASALPRPSVGVEGGDTATVLP
jgi:hypothetical protein